MTTSRSRTKPTIDKGSARRGAEPPIEPESAEWKPEGPAPIAASMSVPGQNDVPPATGKLIGSDLMPVSAIDKPSLITNDETPSSADAGSEPTASASEPTSPTSSNSDAPSPTWRTPRNAREWAAQLNHLATSVLNGTVDLEQAKVVSSISRSAAQLLTAEVQRARFLQIEPDLSLEFDQGPKNSPEPEDGLSKPE